MVMGFVCFGDLICFVLLISVCFKGFVWVVSLILFVVSGFSTAIGVKGLCSA